MKNREYLVNLYLIYGNLLTNNERNYFEYYYYEDYSLTEIAENHDVSKSNVSKVINNVSDKLNEFESKLKIFENHNKIRTILKDNTELLDKIDELL